MSETNFPGFYQTSWDGSDEAKKRVPPGVYFCEIRSASHLVTKEIVLKK